jgi:predicted metal-dependent HD superfamily phosphohydrolase
MNPFKQYKEILEKYIHSDVLSLNLLEAAWREPHRAYHNVDHLKSILEYIEQKRFDLQADQYEALVLAAFFHDVYHNPRDRKIDEDESIKRFITSFDHPNTNVRDAVVIMIESTKHRKRPGHPLVRIFWDADNAGFHKGYDWLLNNEKMIREEYKHVPKPVYKKERVKFLKTNLGLFNKEVDRNINQLIEHVNNTY